MVAPSRTQQAATFLFDEHASRKPFAEIPEAFRPHSLQDAYDVQEAYANLVEPLLGPVAGYKIALTTAVMQKMVGFTEPVAGPIFSGQIFQSPVSLSRADYVHLGAECEIAFELGRTFDADHGPYLRNAVEDGVAAVMTAFEIVDDRNADFSVLAAQMMSAAADTAWNAGAVLGARATDWRNVDLREAKGELCIDGESVGVGYGRDVLGDPVDALVWLVNMMAARGRDVPSGTIVLTGSIVALRFLSAGESLRFEVEGLGSAQMDIVD